MMEKRVARKDSPADLVVSDAFFSIERRYRYVLRRVWDPAVKPLAVIGLNPSTADEVTNDPTVTRCIGYARRWGYGGLVMLNAFAYRSTDPKRLRAVLDPVGPRNDFHIFNQSFRAGLVLAAWGTHADYLDRHRDLTGVFRAAGIELHVLGVTKMGYPRHPLYMPSSAKPTPYTI